MPSLFRPTDQEPVQTQLAQLLAPTVLRPSRTVPGRYRPKRNVPEGDFHIQWSMESTLSSRSVLTDCGIDEWTGVLNFCSSESQEDKEIGTIRCTKIASVDFLSPCDYAEVFDSHSERLSSFATLLDQNGEIREDVRCEVGDRFEISSCGTKLYIDHIDVHPDFRGLGLGLFMVDDACRKLNDRMSLTFLYPAPVNEMSSIERDTAVRKLRQYYRLLGFRALGEEFVARWNGLLLPDLETVCPHLFQ